MKQHFRHILDYGRKVEKILAFPHAWVVQLFVNDQVEVEHCNENITPELDSVMIITGYLISSKHVPIHVEESDITIESIAHKVQS